MKRLLFAAVAIVISAGTALSCAPAPSCWMDECKEYLRSVCSGYARDHKTLKQIAEYVDEPEKVSAFGKACAKLNIRLKAK